VDLKFFCGFSFEEIAGLLGISDRTAKRDWDKARMFLQRELHASPTVLPAFD
jgi:DNA-directed RNA polymerase specialized sigma24 family protein